MNEVESEKDFRILLFCLMTVLFWFSMYTYVPILSAYALHLGASNLIAGIIVGSYGFTQMILRIPIGIASDRIHKRKLFINFGLFFTFFSGLGLWLSDNLTLILIFRSLAGAAAATWVDFTILFSSYYKQKEATKAIGIINFYNNIGQMLAMLFGGIVADSFSWRAPFLLGGVAAAVGIILSFFIIEKHAENAQKLDLRGIEEVVKNRTLISVSVLAILSQLVTFATVYGFTPLYASSLGASKFDMSILTVFSTVSMAIASLYSGQLAEKFGEKSVIICGFILAGIFTATIAVTENLTTLIITQAVAGFGRGISFTMLMGLSIKYMPLEKRATAMGFFQSVYGLGMFVGPFMMGVIGDFFSIKEGFVCIGFIACITALIALILPKSKVQD